MRYYNPLFPLKIEYFLFVFTLFAVHLKGTHNRRLGIQPCDHLSYRYAKVALN